MARSSTVTSPRSKRGISTSSRSTKSVPLPAKKAPAKVANPAKRAPSSRRNREQDEQLQKVWVTYKRTKDPNLRNLLVEKHMPLVKMIAERVLQTLPRSIELDDLISAGTFGLLDAIGGFDLKRGIKFKTYCTTRIRGSILDELRSQDWVPRLVRLKAHRLTKAVHKLEGELGRTPTGWELAQTMGLTTEELLETENEASARGIFSLSEKWDDGDDDNDMEKVDILADKRSADPLQSIDQKDVLDTITRNLTKKERLIVIMYYYEGLTMREIGEIMQLTESRVCQIHSNVMGRLKNQLDQAELRIG